MPIEIKEMVIRATIEESSGGDDSLNAQQNVDVDELVDACVQLVLEILRQQDER